MALPAVRLAWLFTVKAASPVSVFVFMIELPVIQLLPLNFTTGLKLMSSVALSAYAGWLAALVCVTVFTWLPLSTQVLTGTPSVAPEMPWSARSQIAMPGTPPNALILAAKLKYCPLVRFTVAA